MLSLPELAAHHPLWKDLHPDHQAFLCECFGIDTHRKSVTMPSSDLEMVRLSGSPKNPRAVLINVRVVFFDVKRFLFSMGSVVGAGAALYANPTVGWAALLGMWCAIEGQSTKELSEVHARILSMLAAQGCSIAIDEDQLYGKLCDAAREQGLAPMLKVAMNEANTRLAQMKVIEIKDGRIQLCERIAFSKV